MAPMAWLVMSVEERGLILPPWPCRAAAQPTTAVAGTRATAAWPTKSAEVGGQRCHPGRVERRHGLRQGHIWLWRGGMSLIGGDLVDDDL
jgi:hypothetical protein